VAAPTAQQVFEHYTAAVGGRAGWEKLTSRVSRGTVRIEGIDGTGTLLIYERAPNQELSLTTLANGYTLREGFDGKTGWDQDIRGKVKEQDGARAADTRALSDFYSEINYAKLYPHPKLVGQKTADGRLAYVIEASIPGGRQRLLYFDAEDWLLFRTDVFENPLSPVPTVVERRDDYREVDGIKFPYRGSVQGPGINVQYRITALHHNVTVTDDQVARPASSSN
jgi:zinc protease